MLLLLVKVDALGSLQTLLLLRKEAGIEALLNVVLSVTVRDKGAFYVARHTSHLTPHTSHLTPHASPVMRHTSLVTRHTSHVTRHTSHVKRHTSLVTRHTSQICLFGTWLGYTLGVSINGRYVNLDEEGDPL